MPRTIQTITRREAIRNLRRELMKGTDIETSACKVAGDRGIFCNGFRRYSDSELRSRYDWIVAKNPAMTRDELERVANDWQLARQEVEDLPIACDVQQRVRDTCRGWDDFSNDQLAKFYYQMTGQEIMIA